MNRAAGQSNSPPPENFLKPFCGQKKNHPSFHCGDFLVGGPEGDRTLEPHGCEPCALPAELQAQIGTFYAKKVANFGFLKYSIFRGKSNKSDRKTGNRKSGRMCLTMDANRTLSPLSCEPKSKYNYTPSTSICKALFAKFFLNHKNHPPAGRRPIPERRPAAEKGPYISGSIPSTGWPFSVR